jgi:2-polyprenyl-3-methyl-5-hydroxy-6-metoxy-1,4-benzoquinol methylase
MTDYRIDFACDAREPLQRELNALYDYGDDLATQVLHRARLNLFVMLVERLKAQGVIRRFDDALDVGCNAGFYSHLISGFGFGRVLGIDVVPAMIETATRRFGSQAPERSVEFRLMAAEALPAEPRYDFVLCTEVIEHTNEPDRVIETLRTILRPGGVGIVSLPNRLSLPYLAAWAAHRLQGRPHHEDLERHLAYPSTRTLRLFAGGDRRVIMSTGTNLMWDDRLLRALHGSAFFPALNRAQFELGRRWPFKYATQFFYVVFRRDGGQ